MKANPAALRSEFRSNLVSLSWLSGNSQETETVSTGVSKIDQAIGGIPRGAITEICGPNCSGRTSLLISALASRTAEGEACALIDASDAFDPSSAKASGVQLRQLLWVRCKNIDPSLRATDLILHSGGFGLVALDLGDIGPEVVRYVQLNVWFRFRRAVEHTPTIFVVLEREPHAKSSASLVLRMENHQIHWLQTVPGESVNCTQARLFGGASIRSEATRNRVCRIPSAVSLETKWRATG